MTGVRQNRKRMIDPTQERFGLWPERLAADAAYGSAENLAWLVLERIEPHIPVFDKSQRTDGTFSRDEFSYDYLTDTDRCLAGKTLRRYRRQFTVPRTGVVKDNSMRYRASKLDCKGCSLKPQCCPNTLGRKIPRSIHVGYPNHQRVLSHGGGNWLKWPRSRHPLAVSPIPPLACPIAIIPAGSNTICVKSRNLRTARRVPTGSPGTRRARGARTSDAVGYWKACGVCRNLYANT